MAMARARFRVEAEDRSSAQVRGIQRRFQDLGHSVRVLEGPLGGVAGRLSALTAGLGGIGPVGLAAGLALGGTAVVMGKAVKAGEDLERQMGRLDAIIKATGGSAGFTSAEIDEMSRELAVATLASAQGARDAAGLLLTFQSITGDTFSEALRLSQDLAEVMGTDLKSATLQVAKALDDPARGITALRRSGVSFTKQQQEMIVSMSEAGQQAEAQAAILKRLREQVGGAGEGAAGGLAGAVDTLGERWTALMETLSSGTGAGAQVAEEINRIARALELINSFLEGPSDAPDVVAAEERRLSLKQKIATLEQQIVEAQNNGPIAVAMLTKELEGAREELIGIFKEFDRANEIDQMADSMHFARMEAKTMAAEQAKQRSEDEARTKLLEDYEKKLGEVRKALGSTTLKHQEQAAQLKLLEFAYEQGAIQLDEFLELQDKLNEAAKRTQGGVIDFFPGFVAPPPVSRGAGAASGVPARVLPNEEEKKQTGILYRIEKHLANGQTVAVTV